MLAHALSARCWSAMTALKLDRPTNTPSASDQADGGDGDELRAASRSERLH